MRGSLILFLPAITMVRLPYSSPAMRSMSPPPPSPSPASGGGLGRRAWRAASNGRNMALLTNDSRGRGPGGPTGKALMEKMKVDRRKFLAGVAVAGAASTVATPQEAAAAPAVKFPSAAATAAETLVPAALPASPGRPGSDFMVDVIRSLNIDYIA